MQSNQNETKFAAGDNILLRSFYRKFGSDEGPSLEVHVREDDGNWRRIARYDCFRDNPHRHIFTADGQDKRTDWGSGGMESALEATAEELQRDLADVVREAGHPWVAEQLVPEQFSQAAAEATRDMRRRARGET
jgi:hypothetical protein